MQEHEPEPPTTGGIGVDVASLIEGMDPNSLEQWVTALSIPTVLSVLHILEIPRQIQTVPVFWWRSQNELVRDASSKKKKGETFEFEAWFDFRNFRIGRINFRSDRCKRSDLSNGMD